MIKAKADQAKINENLRKISRYYAKWLNLAPALQHAHHDGGRALGGRDAVHDRASSSTAWTRT